VSGLDFSTEGIFLENIENFYEEEKSEFSSKNFFEKILQERK